MQIYNAIVGKMGMEMTVININGRVLRQKSEVTPGMKGIRCHKRVIYNVN